MKKQMIGLLGGLLAAVCVSTAFAGSWKQDQKGWWYQNDDGSYQQNGWFQDADGTYYYFDGEGYMLSDTTTPDGYYVNASGAWIQGAGSGSAAGTGTVAKADPIEGTYRHIGGEGLEDGTKWGPDGTYRRITKTDDKTIRIDNIKDGAVTNSWYAEKDNYGGYTEVSDWTHKNWLTFPDGKMEIEYENYLDIYVKE